MQPAECSRDDGVSLMARRIARCVGLVALALMIALIGAWCALAIWFQLDVGSIGHWLIAGLPVALTVAAIVMLATPWRWRGVLVYTVFIVLMLIWWSTIRPSNDLHWTPDVVRTATATIENNELVVRNVRDFNWRSESDFDSRWETRSYDLSRLDSVDLILSYWAGEAIAHTIISFGFDDGSRLAFSIETRKEVGEEYSPIAGFFRRYELAIIAADERDVVRVRSNIRGEDVRIYRLRMKPADARVLLTAYVHQLNELAHTPRFYNTLTANCTTLVFDMVRVIHPGLPLDPRVLLSGYLPDYVYELGALDTSMPFPQLRTLARIHDRALQAGSDPDFSVRIRVGLPISH